MRMINVADASLASVELGQGSILVMLHGLVTGNMASWYFPCAVPLSQSRKVVLYDLRGHGSSSVPETGYDIAAQVADLEAILDAHGVGPGQPVDLVGHSIGAAIALQFAAAMPSRVRRLALVDPPFPLQEHMAVHAEAFARASSPGGVSQWAQRHAGGVGQRGQAKLRARIEQLLHRTSLPEDLRNAVSPADAILAALNIPILIVAGKRSDCLVGSQRLRKLLPMADWVEVDCGHEIPALAPAELSSALADFFPPDGE